jgi:hypothetical protein
LLILEQFLQELWLGVTLLVAEKLTWSRLENGGVGLGVWDVHSHQYQGCGHLWL